MSVAPNSRVTTHGDDPLGTHLLRGEHAEQADCAVADHSDRCAGLHHRGIGGEPPRAHHVGQRQEIRDHVIRRNIACGHERAVGERDTQKRRLRPGDERAVLAGRLIPDLAMRTGVVAREERSDGELSRRDRPHRAADVFDDAAVLVAHGRRTVGGADAAIRPQVGPADAGRREPDDGIRRFDNFWRRALLETHVAWTVENSSSHDLITHFVY